MTDAMDNLEELLLLSGGDGQIFTMEGPLCMKSVQAMFGYDTVFVIIDLVKNKSIMFSLLTQESLANGRLLLSQGG